MSGAVAKGVLLATALAIGACASTIERVPFTEAEQAKAVDVDIAGARRWADAPAAAFPPTIAPINALSSPATVLALSGGGGDGAFGAGLLNGWSTTGSRPEFSVVSGVSTGALIAPLAFLGPAYDAQLRSFYTETDTRDVMRRKGLFSALFGSSYADSKPLADLIARVVTPAFLDAIAREHGRGRRLFVVTTNLDAQRAVLWDLGVIAASASPRRLALFRSVLLASASVPGVFPPVLIEARAGRRVIREMHTDGGATAQIVALPEAFVARGIDHGGRALDLYLIVNGRVTPSFELTQGRAMSILRRAMGSLLRSSTRGNLLDTKTFADRNGYPLHVAAVADDFVGEAPKPFDRAYMRRLFDYGYRRGTTGAAWSTTTPAMAPSSDGPRPPRNRRPSSDRANERS